jgi:RNA polymerase sigma-70 factor (ECF subfamily)
VDGRHDDRVPSFEPETTLELVRQAQGGDRPALDRLCARYLGPLRRWARNRVPPALRGLLETEDIVQDTLLKTVRNIESFAPERGGGLHSYLRMALDNRLRDAARQARRTPGSPALVAEAPDVVPSHLERLIGRQALERYESALASLAPDVREAVIGRVELGMSYKELAEALGSPSPNAVRMTISRALARIAEEVGREA